MHNIWTLSCACIQGYFDSPYRVLTPEISFTLVTNKGTLVCPVSVQIRGVEVYLLMFPPLPPLPSPPLPPPPLSGWSGGAESHGGNLPLSAGETDGTRLGAAGGGIWRHRRASGQCPVIRQGQCAVLECRGSSVLR